MSEHSLTSIEREEEINKTFTILKSIKSKKDKLLELLQQISEKCLNFNPQISSEHLSQIDDLFALTLDQIELKINFNKNKPEEANKMDLENIEQKIKLLKKINPPDNYPLKNLEEIENRRPNFYSPEGPYYQKKEKKQRKKKDDEKGQFQILQEQKLEYRKSFEMVKSSQFSQPHFKCKICKDNFFLQSSTQCFNHWKRSHCPLIYRCEEHNRKFTSMQDYFMHDFIQHHPKRSQQQEDVICEFCKAKLKRKRFYPGHIFKIHFDIIEEDFKEFQKRYEEQNKQMKIQIIL